MRKLVYAFCLTALALYSTAFANSRQSLYLAADAGIFQANFDNKFLDQADVIPQHIVQPTTQHGYSGGLAAGYRYLFNPLVFIGGELSGHLDGHSAALQTGAAASAFSDVVQIKNHVDLTFVPGLKLSETVAAYLKIGVSYASLQDSLISPAGYIPTSTVTNSNKSSVGFAAGLGFQKQINPSAVLFTEANYHDYGTISFPGFQNFSSMYSHTAHVYSYDVLLGAAYQFNF
jgi:opacity protein-like surface antigen